MTGEITSPTSTTIEEAANTHSVRAEWRAFANFLKQPSLPDQSRHKAGGVGAVLRMLSLDIAFVVIFVAGLFALIAMGVELPDNLNSSLELNAGTIFLIVIGAPLLEEFAFRSWLSGRPRYLIVIPIILITGLVAAMLGATRTGEAAEAAVGLMIIGGLLVSLVAMATLWKRSTPAWYEILFPGAFWLSSVAFALVHFANYTEGSLLVLLPLVLPQFVLGSIAAYLRVHYGLWTAIALHAAHNGIAIGIASLAMASEVGA
uniref:CPBP family glutamic-type intramembrane protease n=1 Tax=uncultured Erythrobacter sp. TaxID=263913 RepID=UPI00260D2711|nr:CPBP family glutamic-type intramembrane protease [uncultured Erythrobacter sp.]